MIRKQRVLDAIQTALPFYVIGNEKTPCEDTMKIIGARRFLYEQLGFFEELDKEKKVLRMKEMNKIKIVKIIWCDSAIYRQWYNKEELEELIKDFNYVESIGYFVSEDKEKIILAGNNDGEESFSAITVIPKSCIKEYHLFYPENHKV